MTEKLAVTIGNPNGIGPEVTAKALSRFSPDESKRFIVISDQASKDYYFGDLNLDFILVENRDYRFNPGEKNAESGRISFFFIQKAVELVKNGKIGGIVTAPVSKEWIVRAGIKNFIDHTTFFAKEFHIEEYNMMFYSGDLKVILATIHIPIGEVSGKINKKTVETAVRNGISFCRSLFPGGYKIGVCGLNPHAGENGLIGSEDCNIIRPVVERFQLEGFPVEGPLPSDSLFFEAYHGKYSLVIAMYHDQGLAPFKLLHFHDGVNLTLGLPVVRTSPDHGTAFGIAGKNAADPNSMLEALRLAIKLTDQTA